MRLGLTALVGVAAAAIVAGTAIPASAAASGGTGTTFTVSGGSLDVSVASTATLITAASGDTTVTGPLGLVTVSDTRGGTAGWVASAVSTAFVGAGTPHTTSTGVSYSPAAVTGSVGVATFTPAAAFTSIFSAGAAVMTASTVTGNNSASWHPILNVTMPSSLLSDTYSGTVTTSVA